MLLLLLFDDWNRSFNVVLKDLAECYTPDMDT